MTDTRPFSPERAVNALPSLSDARISPDGTRIVYVRGQVNAGTGKTESQIWLCDRDGGNRRRLTWVGSRNGGPVWSPDGSQIAFVSQREGDHPNAICLLGFNGGEARVVTSHAAAPSGLAWSPDGSTLAYTVAVDPENPNETPRDPKAAAPVRVVRRIDYKQDGIGYRNDVRSQVFLLDPESGERRQLTTELVDHLRPQWAPDGSRLAVTLPQKNGMRGQVGIIDRETGAMVRVGPEDGDVGQVSWSPDGGSLLFDGDERSRPGNSLFIHNLADHSTRKLADEFAFEPDSGGAAASNPVWLTPDRVLVHGFSRGASELWTVEISTGEATQVGRWEAMHAGLSAPADNGCVVQTAGDLDGLVGLVTINPQTGERTVLFNEAEEFFSESPAASWEKVSIERAGFTIEGWLFKPADFDPGKRYPLVLGVHGGPHGAYGYGMRQLETTVAANGFLVLLTNPRGSSTYGRAFAEDSIGDWGGEDWKDIEAVLDLVLERPYVDRDRTGIYGYSYGGYMTSWVIGHTDRFKAAVCGAPAFDLESMFGTSDLGHTFIPQELGGTPWTSRDIIEERSPSTHIHNATTPTLIIHGEADDRCPIGQAEQMFISLKKVGCEVEFARYPGGAHGFIVSGEPAHRIDAISRTIGWFKRYLGDPS